MIKEKYIQFFLFHQIRGLTTIDDTTQVRKHFNQSKLGIKDENILHQY